MLGSSVHRGVSWTNLWAHDWGLVNWYLPRDFETISEEALSPRVSRSCYWPQSPRLRHCDWSHSRDGHTQLSDGSQVPHPNAAHVPKDMATPCLWAPTNRSRINFYLKPWAEHRSSLGHYHSQAKNTVGSERNFTLDCDSFINFITISIDFCQPCCFYPQRNGRGWKKKIKEIPNLK